MKTTDNPTPIEAQSPKEVAPPLCEPGAEADRFRLFATLREQWRDAEPGRTYTQLAEELGVTKQNVSQWATGTGDRSPPPWWILMELCHRLDLGIGLEPGGSKLYRTSS